MVSQKVLNDGQAVSVAEALASANEVAHAEGVYEREVRIVIEEATTEGLSVWRINYVPVTPPGTFRRGGAILWI